MITVPGRSERRRALELNIKDWIKTVAIDSSIHSEQGALVAELTSAASALALTGLIAQWSNLASMAKGGRGKKKNQARSCNTRLMRRSPSAAVSSLLLSSVNYYESRLGERWVRICKKSFPLALCFQPNARKKLTFLQGSFKSAAQNIHKSRL